MVRVTSGAAAPDQSDPVSSHEPGIYYYDEAGSAPRLVALEPTVYMQTESGGRWKSAFTYGIAKVKSKALLQGARAQIQLRKRRPTFYFHFEATGS
jgi:hypothetical protein